MPQRLKSDTTLKDSRARAKVLVGALSARVGVIISTLELEPIQTYSPDRSQANFDDVRTWLAEVLDGPMRSEFSYVYNGEDLVARDGRYLGPIFTDAITATEEKAEWDPRLKFEKRRVRTEYQEYQDMVEMAKGNGPNTMVVVSDFPEEMKNSGENMGGYNIVRQTAMLRVIRRDEAGMITVVSQSLDRSNRSGLEAIYRHLGSEPAPGELLGQRILLDVEPVNQEFLDAELKNVYDQELSTLFGGYWNAGRNPGEDLNTLDFATKQQDLISAYLKGPMDHKAKYNLSAAITRRYELRNKTRYDQGLVRMFYMTPEMEMNYQGRIAASEGKEFNGCGGTLKMTADGELSDLGYNIGIEGNNSDDSTEMKCVRCPECTTFHEKVRTKAGRPVCDNPDCKLSDKKHQNTEPPKPQVQKEFSLKSYFEKQKANAKTS